MIPKRIILLRHGQSEANVDHEVYAKVPDWKIALTGVGVEQAQAAGRKLAGLIGDESFGVFASPYLRTIQTKDAMLAGIGRKPVFDYQDSSLREQEYGNAPPVDVNRERHAERREFGMFFYRFAEGESCADVYDRMAIFMNTLFRRFDRSDCPENLISGLPWTGYQMFLGPLVSLAGDRIRRDSYASELSCIGNDKSRRRQAGTRTPVCANRTI